MDMIGEGVVGLDQRRHSFLEARQRQAVGGIDAGGTQDADLDAGLPPPATQAAFGIDPTPGPTAFGAQTAGFVDPRPRAIAVNPRRAYVNQAPW